MDEGSVAARGGSTRGIIVFGVRSGYCRGIDGRRRVHRRWNQRLDRPLLRGRKRRNAQRPAAPARPRIEGRDDAGGGGL